MKWIASLLLLIICVGMVFPMYLLLLEHIISKDDSVFVKLLKNISDGKGKK